MYYWWNVSRYVKGVAHHPEIYQWCRLENCCKLGLGTPTHWSPDYSGYTSFDSP